jgi:hypothetical protein
MISSSSVPGGVRIVTTSPACAFKSAVAIGEIHETPPRAGSSSSTPTMLTVPSAPDSSATVGSEPISAQAPQCFLPRRHEPLRSPSA